MILHGFYGFASRLFCYGPGSQIAVERMQHKTYHRMLVSGAVFGVVGWLASKRYASDSLLVLAHWVILTHYLAVCILLTDFEQAIEAGHVVATYTEPSPAPRFRSAMNGAISSILLALLTIYSCNLTQFNTTFTFRAVGVSKDIISRESPHTRGERPTCSPPSAKGTKPLSTACTDLPSKVTQSERHSGQSYISSILLQWSLAILKSFVMLTPELMTYRLLHWLSTEQKGSARYEVGLALLLGLSKISKLVSTTGFLVTLVGWTVLNAGLLASALAMPITVVLSRHYGNAQTEQAKSHEQRSAMLTDALLAIRQIKLSTLEGTWRQRIQQWKGPFRKLCLDRDLFDIELENSTYNAEIAEDVGTEILSVPLMSRLLRKLVNVFGNLKAITKLVVTAGTLGKSWIAVGEFAFLGNEPA
ncbi:hypothetical protein MY3957_009287 [Beauveria namnaoensis]